MEPQGRQRNAVESTENQVLVVAPPGCGKTEVLAMRANYLIRGGFVRPQRRLLAITYSKRARDNMRDRIRGTLGYEMASRYVTVLNFHGLAGRLVRAHGTTLDIPQDVIMPTRRWFKDTAFSLGAGWESKASAESRLLRLKSGPTTDEEIRAALAGTGDELALAIERQRIAENRLDYPDLIRHAQRLVRVPQIARLYQEHFDAILVDEFQDLSMQQLDLVSNVCVRNATFVGDPLQGIYSWAGAQPDEVEVELVKRCTERVDLDISYRSSPEVLKVVNAVGVPIGATELSAADPAAWGSLGQSVCVDYPSEEGEASAVVKVATDIARASPEQSIAIIARSGYRRTQIDRALVGVTDVPLQFWDIALDHPGLLTVLRSAAAGIQKGDPLSDQLEQLRERALKVIGDDEPEALGVLDDAIELIEERAGAGESVRDILQRTRGVDVAAVAPPGVHVLNAHLGKGQQFDWVFVIGLEDGHVPDYRSLEDPEERRVLMVMLSRAKRGVVMTRARMVKTKYGTKTAKASRWWPLMEAAAQRVESK